MPYTDYPVADFASYDRQQQDKLAELPVCDCCQDPIQDEFYFEIHSEVICPVCMDQYYRKEVC